MKVYRVDDDENVSWHGALRDARREANRTPAVFRGAVRIHEVYIRTDKQGVLCLLKSNRPAIEREGREWRLSARGGLRLLERSVESSGA